MIRMNRFTLSHDCVTCHRSPEVSSTAFDAQPPDLPPVSLMDMGFAVSCPLARHRSSYPVLVHRLASLLRASFRPRLAASVISPLRFAITSRPSRCEEDLHLQAVDHARHTNKSPRSQSGGQEFLFELEESLQAQLHVESFSGPDDGGSIEVADSVGDDAAAWAG